MLLLPMHIHEPDPDSSFRQDIRAFEERLDRARRWRRRRRRLMLRNLLNGRKPRRARVPAGRPPTACRPLPAQ